MTSTSLETPRLVLERWAERHRAAWHEICLDPEVMRYIGVGVTLEREPADKVFDRALAHWDEHGFGWRSALPRGGGDWLGFIGLNHVGRGTSGVGPEEVEIGWWIVREQWGRGLASEGAAALRDEAFGRLGLARIIARTQPANVASARVAEKLGMRFERMATGRHGEPIRICSLARGEEATAG